MKKLISSFLDSIPEFPGVGSFFGKQDNFLDLRDEPHRILRKKVIGQLLLAIAVLFMLLLLQINTLIERSAREIRFMQGQETFHILSKQDPIVLRTSYTVLIVGKEDQNRADTIILAHLFLKEGKIRLMSIPRDTRVEIMHNQKAVLDKIGHSFRWGKATLMKDSLEKFLGFRFDHTIIIDLAIFRKIIDTIGGVEVEVEKPLKYTDKAGGLFIDIQAGKQILDGKKAEGFVRYRSDGKGDLGRIERQQIFIQAFAKRVRDLNSFQFRNLLVLGRLPQFAMNLIRDIESDMEFDFLFKLLLIYSRMEKSDITHLTLPGTGEYIEVPEMKKKINFYISSQKEITASREWFLGLAKTQKSEVNP